MNNGDLAGRRHVLFDLDGCIWFGDVLADGAAELVRDLRDGGRTVGFVTNISSGRSHDVAAKLTRLGIPTTPEQVLMPVEALAAHPRMAGRPVALVIGQEELRTAVAELTEVTHDPDRAELVLLSRDPNLHYDDLADALQPLLRGAPLLALNADLRVPVAGGRILPGAGVLAVALATAAGIEVEVVGKPSRFFLDTALRRFGIDRDQTVMVGDTLDSDIAGGIAAGLATVHVGGDHRSLRDPAPTPDLSLPDVRALRAVLGL